MKGLGWRFFPLLTFVLLAFFLWLGLAGSPQKLPSSQIGKPLPNFQLPALVGESSSAFTPLIMQGQIALLNVWASWCTSCAEEQVFLLRLAREKVAIYGLNYKDRPRDAKRWLREWGNPYRAIGIDREGKLAIDLGVYGTPETFLIDKKGIITYRHIGVVDETVWKRDFLPRIKQLQGLT